MPKLENPRYEKLAQGKADGLSWRAAYEDAGFTPGKDNDETSKRAQDLLRRKPEIRERADEIYEFSEKVESDSESVDKKYVLRELVEIVTANRDTKPAVANKALELIGKSKDIAFFDEGISAHGLDALIAGMDAEQIWHRALALTAMFGQRFVAMTEEENDEWAFQRVRISKPLADRIHRELAERPEVSGGAPSESASDVPTVSEASGVPRTRLQ